MISFFIIYKMVAYLMIFTQYSLFLQSFIIFMQRPLPGTPFFLLQSKVSTLANANREYYFKKHSQYEVKT